MSPLDVQDVSFGRLHSGPADPGTRRPGLVLIHDVWGPSEHSRDLASELASEGFVVLEIDLYRNRPKVEIEAPGPFIQSLSDSEILADLEAAGVWLARQPGVGPRCGIVGVCMGGTYALLAACTLNCYAAAAPFYGILSYDAGLIANPEGRDHARKPRSPIEAAPDLRMPLLASFGAEDDFVPASDVEALRGALRGSRFPAEIDVHEGAGHAFLNRTRAAAYRESASSRAWQRVIPFLKAELDPAY